MPTMDEGAFAVTASFRSGTKLEAIEEKTVFLEEMMAADPDIDHYSYQISGDDAVVTAYLTEETELTTNEAIEKYSRALANQIGRAHV